LAGGFVLTAACVGCEWKKFRKSKKAPQASPDRQVRTTYLDFLIFFRERRSIRQDCPLLNTFLGMQKSII